MMTSARPCRAYRRGTRDPEALGLDTKGRRRNLRPARPALTRTLGVAVGDCEHLGEPLQPRLAGLHDFACFRMNTEVPMRRGAVLPRGERSAPAHGHEARWRAARRLPRNG